MLNSILMYIVHVITYDLYLSYFSPLIRGLIASNYIPEDSNMFVLVDNKLCLPLLF